jgi:hypothetical protein
VKRGIVLILGILVAGTVAAVLTFCLLQRPRSTDGWLQREFSLTDEQMRQVRVLQQGYEGTCQEICERIQQSDARLAALLASSDRLTPEVQAALADTDRVRTDCRTRMLEHFYRVAAVIPENERPRYLEMVLPLIERPEQMGAHNASHRGR